VKQSNQSDRFGQCVCVVRETSMKQSHVLWPNKGVMVVGLQFQGFLAVSIACFNPPGAPPTFRVVLFLHHAPPLLRDL